jgi:hypothetical protein
VITVAGVIFPPAWALPECGYLLDLVARQVLYVRLLDDYEFAWVWDDECAPARLIEVDRALAVMALMEGGFLGLSDAAALRGETGKEFQGHRLIFGRDGRELHEYLTNRPR